MSHPLIPLNRARALAILTAAAVGVSAPGARAVAADHHGGHSSGAAGASHAAPRSASPTPQSSRQAVPGSPSPHRTPGGAVAGTGGSGTSHHHLRDGRVFVAVPWFFGGPFFYYDSWRGTPYGYPPGYVYAPDVVDEEASDVALFELHVHPRKVSVMVNGRYEGQARDFNDMSHPLALASGRHVLELEYPGFQTLRVDLDAEGGRTYELHYELYEGEGTDPRSSPPAPAERTGPGRGKPAGQKPPRRLVMY